MRRWIALGTLLVVAVLAGRELFGSGASGPRDAVRRSAPPPPTLGGWVHRADPQDRGLDAGWAKGLTGARRVAVPGAPTAVRVAGRAGARTFAGSVGWWQATLRTPRPGRYDVRFGSVSHRATVWVDGRRACGHTGAYEPFSCRVTLGRAGVHRLVLRADWRDPDRQAREGWDRAWFNFGGPAWAVTVREVGEVDLALLTVRTRLASGAARVTFRLAVRDTRAEGPTVRLRLRGDLRRGRTRVPVSTGVLSLRPGQRRSVETEVRVRDPALWEPGRPALYDLRLASTTGAASVRRRVGLRDLRRRGGALILNGRPLRLLGVGLPPDAQRHGDALTAADRREIVAEVEAVGANLVRSQLPLSDAMLDDLDAAGIFVWQLVGPFNKAGKFWAQNPERRIRARTRILRTVDREASHPSVLAWSLSNELAGQGHPAGQAAHLDRLAVLLQRRTPGILVAADVWGAHPPREPGRAFAHLDAIGITEYIGMTELAGAPVEAQSARAREGIDALRAIFPRTALVVTEFGANANGRNPSDRPGGFRYQSRLLRERIALYASHPQVAGMSLWTLRDYAVSPGFAGGSLRRALPDLRLSGSISEKGLFRYDGSPKPSVAVVREAYAAAGGGS